ncbi:MAG: polyprenyl synthetase family protein [Candidatus Aminicenantales bacterium]
MFDVDTYIKTEWPDIEKELLQVIPKSGKNSINNLHDAIWYHFGTGGKRLRPLLAIETCRAFGGNVEQVIPFAAACEVFHNWTLIHDDIEDGDKVRRNKPAVWVKYGLSHGINIGDYMQHKVYELVLKCKSLGIDIKTVFFLFDEICRTASNTAEGQTMDMNLRKNDKPTEKDYIDMVTKKTAYYLTIPIIGGAIIAGASKSDIEKIKEFGKNIGPAFQITDDLLDLTSKKGRLEIGCDIKEGKRTLMVVHCAHKCTFNERKKLFNILNKGKEATTKKGVSWVKGLFEKYGSIEYAKQRARIFREQAEKVIVDMKPEVKEILTNFGEYMVNRKH